MLRYLRGSALPIVTIVVSAPLFFSFQLKTPPAYLKGYFFVLAWSWGIFGALLAPLCLALECVALVSFVFAHAAVEWRAIARHVLAALVALGGLLILWAARHGG
jgi:hypothetical protein